MAAINQSPNLVAANISQIVSSNKGTNSQVLAMELRAPNSNLQAHQQSVETHIHNMLGSIRALTVVIQTQSGAPRDLYSLISYLIDDACNRQVSQLSRSVLNVEEPEDPPHTQGYPLKKLLTFLSTRWGEKFSVGGEGKYSFFIFF